MAENFDLIFGQNASQQYAWNDTDYLNGWETIGNIPPTAAQFDALQRRSDTKMKELNDELTPLVNADTADTRQPSTSYNVDDIKYSPLLPTGWYLLCTTGGTTSASDLVITSPAVGNTVTDGTVVWKINKVASTADVPAPVDISGKANTSLNNLTTAGENKIKSLAQTASDTGFTIIYPNGGSAAAPANVTKKTRYVENNPFPGYYVHCVAEIFYLNQWGSTGYTGVSTTASAGVNATQLNDSQIIVQTGIMNLAYSAPMAGGSFANTDVIAGPAPCRVKVWKIGKIPN
jgi:hypothetical protein